MVAVLPLHVTAFAEQRAERPGILNGKTRCTGGSRTLVEGRISIVSPSDDNGGVVEEVPRVKVFKLNRLGIGSRRTPPFRRGVQRYTIA